MRHNFLTFTRRTVYTLRKMALDRISLNLLSKDPTLNITSMNLTLQRSDIRQNKYELISPKIKL